MGSSGGPGKIDSLNYGNQLEGMANKDRQRGSELYRTTTPLFQEQVGQSLEALRTGGVGAQIPVIQRAVEQSKLATSGAMRGAEDRLRGAGLSGSPFGQRVLSDTATSGALATSRIPTSIAQSFIAGAPGLSSQGFGASQNFSSLGANTMGNLQSMDLQRQMANAAQFQAMMNGFAGGMGSVMCLHPDTPIETPSGSMRVSALRAGDAVYSQDADGNKIVEVVKLQTQSKAPAGHRFAKVHCPRGEAWISAAHPLPDGKPVVSAEALRLTEHVSVHPGVTMDILVSGPTGIYFVLGLALGSTLDARHRRVA